MNISNTTVIELTQEDIINLLKEKAKTLGLEVSSVEFQLKMEYPEDEGIYKYDYGYKAFDKVVATCIPQQICASQKKNGSVENSPIF